MKPSLPSICGLLLSAVLLASCASSGGGGDSLQGTADTRGAKPYPLDFCLVSGEALDGDAIARAYNGQTMKFCCPACVKKYESEPDGYILAF